MAFGRKGAFTQRNGEKEAFRRMLGLNIELILDEVIGGDVPRRKLHATCERRRWGERTRRQVSKNGLLLMSDEA